MNQPPHDANENEPIDSQDQSVEEPPKPLPDEYTKLGWSAQAILAQLVELLPEAILQEALELDRRRRATILQTKPGVLTAAVRETSSKPNRIEIRFDIVSEAAWEGILESIIDQHSLTAQMLAGFVPEELETLAMSKGVSLIPSLSAAACRPKHPEGLQFTRAAVATILAFTRFIEASPASLLTLRGLDADQALERLHQRQSLRNSASGDAPAYIQRPIHTESPTVPLEMCLENFWAAGSALDHIDTTPRLPEVECPLLRRLGPSPFTEAKFPLLGLLATCYDQIARAQLEDVDQPIDEQGFEG